MEQRLNDKARRYSVRQKRKLRWKKIMSILGCMVVFVTTYALILPAITLDHGPECGIEEHQHDSTCYLLSESEQMLICQLLEREGHIHGDTCYESLERYVCEMEEDTGHIHDETCYAESEELICEDEEVEAHSHHDACYDAEGQLICEQEESDGHHHSESCYERESILDCTQEESEGHVHTEACVETELVLTCTESEEEAHIHGETCYESGESELILICEKEEHIHTKSCESEWTESEPSESVPEESAQIESEPIESIPAESETVESVPVESEAAESETVEIIPEESSPAEIETVEAEKVDLEEVKEEVEISTPSNAIKEEVETSTPSEAEKDTEYWTDKLEELDLDELDELAEQFLAVAKSQIGYTESDLDYIIDQNGEKKGYTCYGDWYGEPYADWDAVFLAYCLSYVDMSENEFPFSNDHEEWMGLLKDHERYHTNYEGLKPGDIIFFDHDQDGVADHTGLLRYINENGSLKTVEGDVDNSVQSLSYIAGDPRILGFASLPDQETKQVQKSEVVKDLEKVELIAEVYQDASYDEWMEDSMTIRIKGYIPEGVIAKAYPVEVEIEGYTVICAYDISLYFEDGTLFEPTEEHSISVSFQADNFPQVEDEDIEIHYVPDHGEPKPVETTNVLEDGITFKADHFSVYAVTSARSITASHNTLIYNEQADAFIRDDAYSKYYNANSPIGTAGSFHVVGFGTVTLYTHTNGNILAHTLYANTNFGTNNYPDELSYALHYEKVAHTSASMTQHILAFGHDNQVTLVNNRNQFAINGTQIDKPYNLIQDVNSVDAPFIDLERVEAEIRQISSNLNGYSSMDQASGVTHTPRSGNMQESVLKLNSPDSVGAITFKASELSSKLDHSVQLTGFESGHDGTLIINVDCTGVTKINMPKALIYIDGKAQGTNEVTQFDNGKVIWNFVNAEGVTIEAQQMTGMIVAPGATVNINQNLNGTVVAENINVRAESHRTDFTGKVVEPDIDVEENEYHITVQKTETGYTGTTLPGAEFDLYEYREDEWIKVNTVPLVTGENGLVVLRHLATDIAYKLVETKAPHGYKLADDEFLFWVRSKSTVTQPAWVPEGFNKTSLNKGGVLIAANEKLTGDETTSLRINKVWLDQDGEELKNPGTDNIYVRIYQIPNGDESQKSAYKMLQLKAEEGWTLLLENLPAVHFTEDGTLITYTYQVEELAVDGFEITYIRADELVTIINTQMPFLYELPETGGIGIYWYMICGIAFILYAVIKGYGKWKCNERRSIR